MGANIELWNFEHRTLNAEWEPMAHGAELKGEQSRNGTGGKLRKLRFEGVAKAIWRRGCLTFSRD
jgi:hypothetical protein